MPFLPEINEKDKELGRRAVRGLTALNPFIPRKVEPGEAKEAAEKVGLGGLFGAAEAAGKPLARAIAPERVAEAERKEAGAAAGKGAVTGAEAEAKKADEQAGAGELAEPVQGGEEAPRAPAGGGGGGPAPQPQEVWRVGPSVRAAKEAGDAAYQRALEEGADEATRDQLAQQAFYGSLAADKQAQADAAVNKEKDRQAVLQTQLEHYQNVAEQVANDKIDPDRLYASKNTGQVIAHGIGMLLGGFLQGFQHRGDNPFLTQWEHTVDRDVEAQKIALEQHRGSLNASANLYGMMRERFADSRQAEAATKAALAEKTAADIQRLAAQSRSTQVQNDARMAAAGLQQKKAEWLQGVLAYQTPAVGGAAPRAPKLDEERFHQTGEGGEGVYFPSSGEREKYEAASEQHRVVASNARRIADLRDAIAGGHVSPFEIPKTLQEIRSLDAENMMRLHRTVEIGRTSEQALAHMRDITGSGTSVMPGTSSKLRGFADRLDAEDRAALHNRPEVVSGFARNKKGEVERVGSMTGRLHKGEEKPKPKTTPTFQPDK